MFVFLVLVGLLIAVLHRQLWDAMLNNLGLNVLICFVLLAGVLYAFQQVLRLYPEIRWVNAFRIADPGLAISHRPVLLSPMATMLRDRTGSLSLSATSMRSIMDFIGGRLDEARDTGRYLVGLLVFLGLLGTFWGLLDTIQSVGKTISSLDSRAADSVTVFDELKNGLAAPLRGMGRPSPPRSWAWADRWSWAFSSCRRATLTAASTISWRNGCPASPSWRPACRTPPTSPATSSTRPSTR